jgi:amino acid permease
MKNFIFSSFICLVGLNLITIGPVFGETLGAFIAYFGIFVSIIAFIIAIYHWSEWKREELIKEMVNDYKQDESELGEMDYNQIKKLHKKLEVEFYDDAFMCPNGRDKDSGK